jgi:hypothetical protein
MADARAAARSTRWPVRRGSNDRRPGVRLSFLRFPLLPTGLAFVLLSAARLPR